jgi:hypothetical protein
MTIYLVHWQEGEKPRHHAVSSLVNAEKKHKEVLAQQKSGEDIQISDPQQAIKSYRIKSQPEVIELINSLTT